MFFTSTNTPSLFTFPCCVFQKFMLHTQTHHTHMYIDIPKTFLVHFFSQARGNAYIHKGTSHTDMCMFICCGVVIWSKFGVLESYYLVQVCFFNTVYQKHDKNRDFNTDLEQTKLRTKNSGVIIWSKLAFLKRTQLGPDNSPDLDQKITPQNAFFVFLLLKMC